MSTAIDTPVEGLARERSLGFLKNPVLIALIITVLLIVVGQIVSPASGLTTRFSRCCGSRLF